MAKADTDKQSKYPAKRKAGLKPFEPGQSGNPKGPPKATTQLYRYFCLYMDMTEDKLGRLDKSKLTMSQLGALAMVNKIKEGSWPQQREVIERDEGKVPQKTELSGPEGEPMKFYTGIVPEDV